MTMANRPDRRKQKSRQAILSAFRTLLTQKRYSDITVQEIIDLADVGRSTFYAHFETKDTLLAELCADISAHVVAPHQHAESSHDFSGVKPDAATVVTHIFYHLRDDHRNLVMMLKGSSRALFLHYFKHSLTETFQAIWGGAIAEVDLPEDFLLSHITGAFVDALDWWISRDMADAPEIIAGYYLKTIEPILGDG
jgi:AcrR family transcriptional regulator